MKNIHSKKNSITFWHPNGKKYFSYLTNVYNVKFINIYFFRKFFSYHSKKNILNFKKPFILDNINIVCLPPFDINIIYFVIGKIFKPNSILILHTSDILHEKGYIFKTKLTKYIYKFCINNYFNSIIYLNKLQLEQLNINYTIPKYYIPHHINPSFFSDNIIQIRDIDIIFVGEKSYKKGYDRFVKLSNILKVNSYSIGTSFLNINNTKNITNLNNLPAEELPKYLTRSKFLILPSRKYKNWEELFSQIAIEAISCGVIVISTNHIGPKFLNTFYNLPIYLFDDDEEFSNNVSLFIKNYTPKVYDFELSDFHINSLLKKWQKIFN